MFEDVAEMEREIEAFRKNIVASSELVEGISQLTVETQKQKESFSESTKELIDKLEKCIEQFKSDHESALRSLSDSNDAAIETLQKNMLTEQKARIAELERIEAELQKNLTDAVNRADVQVDTLSKTSDAVINAFHQDAEMFQNLSLEQIKQLNADCEQIITELKSMLEAQEKLFAEKLNETETVIKNYQASAESKYAEFVKQLETTNVDQIFKEVQELKKSVQTKFAVLAGGIGITLLITIIELIIK